MISLLVFLGVFIGTYGILKVGMALYDSIKDQKYLNSERVFYGFDTKPITLTRRTSR